MEKRNYFLDKDRVEVKIIEKIKQPKELSNIMLHHLEQRHCPHFRH